MLAATPVRHIVIDLAFYTYVSLCRHISRSVRIRRPAHTYRYSICILTHAKVVGRARHDTPRMHPSCPRLPPLALSTCYVHAERLLVVVGDFQTCVSTVSTRNISPAEHAVTPRRPSLLLPGVENSILLATTKIYRAECSACFLTSRDVHRCQIGEARYTNNTAEAVLAVARGVCES